ncbi:hypothetical protein HJG60_008101 [Phyllostomus discolor]|uniref:Uncharacterized protein n=1 Tax=Phyllostomus discolor TaxID=89673 RepID=A0A834EVW5_9CHIR|nr:hypothetical protein HJG60_008101 [Phyllostomus discolor]
MAFRLCSVCYGCFTAWSGVCLGGGLVGAWEECVICCRWRKWSAGAGSVGLAGWAVELDHVLTDLLPAGSVRPDGGVWASPTATVGSSLSVIPALKSVSPDCSTAVPVLCRECLHTAPLACSAADVAVLHEGTEPHTRQRVVVPVSGFFQGDGSFCLLTDILPVSTE